MITDNVLIKLGVFFVAVMFNFGVSGLIGICFTPDMRNSSSLTAYISWGVGIVMYGITVAIMWR